MKIHCAAVALAGLLSFALSAAAADCPNALSEEEQKAGFELLFDGVDFAGWSQKGNWKVEEGAIFRAGRGGELVYDAKPLPDDFELRFEWKVAKGSNSGVYYRPTQYEYQILDNQTHPDGRNPRTSAASLYFCMAPSHDATRPVGQWNSGRIVCKGTVIQHWLNGQKVVGFDYADPKYAKEVDLLRRRGGDLTRRGEKLHLQDHGDPVWYRGIKLRKLGEGDPLDAAPVTPAVVSAEALAHEEEIIQRIQSRQQPAKKGKAAKK